MRILYFVVFCSLLLLFLPFHCSEPVDCPNGGECKTSNNGESSGGNPADASSHNSEKGNPFPVQELHSPDLPAHVPDLKVAPPESSKPPLTHIKVSNLSLIDATKDVVIQGYETIKAGQNLVLDLGKLPSRSISFQAFISKEARGALFHLNGKKRKIDITDPYSMNGGKDRNFLGWTPPLGPYVLTVWAKDNKDGLSRPYTISFNVIDSKPPKPWTPPAYSRGPKNTEPCGVPSPSPDSARAVLSDKAKKAYQKCMTGKNAAKDPFRRDACHLLNLLNKDRAMFHREANNAPAVDWDENLWLVAIGHSKDMCKRKYFGHKNPDGLSARERTKAAGFPNYGWVGENIANWPDPESAHYAWMREPTCTAHRRQILDPQAIAVGIGITRCLKTNGNYGNYSLTQNYHINQKIKPSPFCAKTAPTRCRRPRDPPSSAVCRSLCGLAAKLIMKDWGCSCK